MAVVYKAYDTQIKRHVAIKLLRAEIKTEPEYRARFLSESHAAGKLIHPNIVTIYDVGECELGPYIAMEFVQGPTLEQVMAEDKQLPVREVLNIVVQLASALGYAHTHGIVHRDVKPGNIMCSSDLRSVRITDFGIAHIDSDEHQHRTLSGAILGTPRYMSPEQIEGLAVDGRSDLFSLGVIMYQLLTGKRPFVANTLASLYAKIVREDSEPMDVRLPASVRRMVEKLLEKDPARRFADGEELASALRGLIQELDEQERRQAEARRLPLRVRFTVVLALLVTLSMAAAAFMVHRSEVSVLTSLAMDFGASLARFVATQSAEPMLLEDWVAVEYFVDETRKRQQITHLHLVDRNGILRGSSTPEHHGKPFVPLQPTGSMAVGKDVTVHELVVDGERQLDFEVPIRYLDKTVGQVHLGLSRTPLDRAADLILYIMLGLMLAVILVVIIVAYLMAGRITTPLQVLHSALVQAGRGHLTHRISERRDDEIGELFDEFNRMAEAFCQQRDNLSATLPQPISRDTLPPEAAAPLSPDTPTRVIQREDDEVAKADRANDS